MSDTNSTADPKPLPLEHYINQLTQTAQSFKTITKRSVNLSGRMQIQWINSGNQAFGITFEFVRGLGQAVKQLTSLPSIINQRRA
jgi:hypothetical protein